MSVLLAAVPIRKLLDIKRAARTKLGQNSNHRLPQRDESFADWYGPICAGGNAEIWFLVNKAHKYSGLSRYTFVQRS